MTWNKPITPYSAPCKDCEERHDLCHTNCNRYLDFKEKVREYGNDIKDRTRVNITIRDMKRGLYK